MSAFLILSIFGIVLAVQYHDRQQPCFIGHVENLCQSLKSVSHEVSQGESCNF